MIMIIVAAFVAWVLWLLLAPSVRVVWGYRGEVVQHVMRGRRRYG